MYGSNEDIVFSMGLTAAGLELQLTQTEQVVANKLNAMAANFESFSKRVADSSNNAANRFGIFKKDMINDMGTLKAAFAEATAGLKEFFEIVKQPAQYKQFIEATKGIAEMQRELDKLKDSRMRREARNDFSKELNAQKEMQREIGASTRAGQKLISVLKDEGPARNTTLVNNILKQISATITKVQKSGTIDFNTSPALAKLRAVRSQILAIQNGPAKAQQQLFKFSGTTLNQNVQQMGGYLRNISTLLSTIGLGGGIFALVYGFKSLVKQGIEFNSELEQARISLAAIVTATAQKIEIDGKVVTGVTAIEAVQGNVNKLVNQMKIDALAINGGFQDLLGIAEAITSPILRTGKGLDDVRKLVNMTGIAASVLGVNFKEATTGMLQMLQGTVNARNALIKRLPIPTGELRAMLQDSTGRVDAIMGVLQKLMPAGPLLQQTFKATSENIKDLVVQITGITFEPLKNRLNDLFKSIFANVVRFDEKTMSLKFSPAFQQGVEKAQQMVASLVRQVTFLTQQLFNRRSGESFFDTMQVVLPKVVDALFAVATVIKSIASFMLDNGAATVKVLGYFLGFKMVVGIFNSIRGMVLNTANSLGALSTSASKVWQLFAGMSTAMQTARAQGTGLSGAFAQIGTQLAGVKAALMSAFSVGAIAAFLVVIVEIVSEISSARKETADFDAALKSADRMQFDGLLSSLDRVNNRLREGASWVRKMADAMLLTQKTALGEDIDKVSTIGNTSSSSMRRASVAAGFGVTSFDPAQSADDAYDRIRRSAQKITQLREMYNSTSDQKARNQIEEQITLYTNLETAAKSHLEVLKGIGTATDILQSKHGISMKDLNRSPIGQFNKATERARALAALDADKPEATIIGRRPEEVEDENGAKAAANRHEQSLAELRSLMEQRLRVLDKMNEAERARLVKGIDERRISQQEAAREEIERAESLRDKKLKVLDETWTQMERLVDMDAIKKHFGDFKADDDTDSVQKRLTDFTLRADQGKLSKAGKAKFEVIVAGVKQFMSLMTAGQVAQENYEKSLAGAQGDIADADRRKAKTLSETNAELAKQRAEREAELLQATNLAVTLDERLAREKEISELLIARSDAEIDRATNAKVESFKANSTLSPADVAKLTDGAMNDAAEEKRLNRVRQGVALANARVAVMSDHYQLQLSSLAVLENEADRMETILGMDNLITAQAQDRVKLQKAAAMKAEAALKREQSSVLQGVNNPEAIKLHQEAELLEAAAKNLEVAALSYMDVVGGSLSRLGSIISRIFPGAGSGMGSIGSMFSAIGQIQRIGGTSFKRSDGSDAGKGFSGMFKSASGLGSFGDAFKSVRNAGKGIAGIAAMAGPVGAIAGAAIDLFSGVASIFSNRAIEIVKEQSEVFSKSIDGIMDNLRRQRTGLSATLDALTAKLNNVTNEIAKPKVNAVGNFFTFGLAGRSANSAWEDEIKKQREALQDQIDQLRKDAEDAVRDFETKTLPLLRLHPDQRAFFENLQAIREEMKKLSETPGINKDDVNEMFGIKLLDLRREAEASMTQLKESYLSKLKEEQSLQEQLISLAERRSDAEKAHTKQRNEILGFVERQVSKAQQLAELEADYAKEQSDIAKQEEDLKFRLDMVTKEVEQYKTQFGIVTDMKKFELEMHDAAMAKERERFEALKGWWDHLNFVIGETLDKFQTLPASLSSERPTSAVTPGNVIVTFGDMTFGPGVDAKSVKEAFVEGAKAWTQSLAQKGLAYGDA
jgi:hypothetical protein